ncbi:MAG: J domain-containing protein [Deltaproteobacteria bacterium]|nr:J domain-containing protein [Deltaproteobacteria bacterium]
MATTFAPAELRALARLLDELDYYELLEAPRGTAGTALREAYHAASRRFHPDANRRLDPELRGTVERIARRVTEAYSVLRDPRRRRLYDEALGRGDGPRRLQLVESAATATQRTRDEREGRTPQGRRHFAQATADIARGDVAGALRSLQLALTYEPDNAQFRTRLSELRDKTR